MSDKGAPKNGAADEGRSSSSEKDAAAKAEFFQPPAEWKKKIRKGVGLDPKSANQKAKAVLESLHRHYVTYALGMFDDIEETLKKAQKKPVREQRQALSEIHVSIAEIKSEAGSLGFCLATKIGEKLCNYIDGLEELTPLRCETICLQTHSLRIALQQKIADGNDQAKTLLASIDAMIAKTSA